MWEFETAIDWASGKEGSLQSGTLPEILVSTPAEFGGPPGRWSPEDLLAGAAGSCVMTTSLFYLERAGIKPLSYNSRSTAMLDKSKDGLIIKGVAVEVTVSVASKDEVEKAYSAIEKAETSCPISKSLKCDVSLKVSVTGPTS